MNKVKQNSERSFILPFLSLFVGIAILGITTDAVKAKVLIWDFSVDESQIKNGPELDGSTNSPATGSGHVEYDTATNIISYSFTWNNLFADLTKLHIHGPADTSSNNPAHLLEIFGPPDIPASVNLRTDTWSDSHPLQTLQQTGINPMTNQPFDPITPSEIIAIMESGLAYLNVHTEVFGMGEIRGNLGLPVPEPSTLGMLVFGVTCLGPRRFR